MSDNYEFAESLGTHHPGEVGLTVAQAEERERNGIPLPISGDAETDHARELLAIGRARRTTRAMDHISWDTGGFDPATNELLDASFACHDCGLSYSWPVTEGLAANDDQKQTEMLALVAEHTPAVCRAAQAAAAVELEKVLATEAELIYDEHQDEAVPLGEVNMLIKDVIKNEMDGYPCPISGDPAVTLQEAIDRGAVTFTKGLPDAVVWRRSNPGLAKPLSPFHWTSYGLRESLNLWPAPSHQALTDSITALAGVQRRLMIGGRLPVRSES